MLAELIPVRIEVSEHRMKLKTEKEKNMRISEPRRTMRTCMYVTLFLLLSVASAQTAELRKLNLDGAKSIGTKISTDQKIKIEGSGSIKISTLWPTTINLGEISGLGVDNTKLVYRAKVKCEKLQGAAFLEMWCHVGGGQYFSRGMNPQVTGTMDWKTLQTPFILQAGQKVEKITLNIVINGKGTVWIDDLMLLKEPL